MVSVILQIIIFLHFHIDILMYNLGNYWTSSGPYDEISFYPICAFHVIIEL